MGESNNYVIADSWMPFPILESASTQRDIVINHHVITNNRCFANNNAHSMIDKESSANSCARMDLDTGCSSNPVRIKAR